MRIDLIRRAFHISLFRHRRRELGGIARRRMERDEPDQRTENGQKTHVAV